MLRIKISQFRCWTEDINLEILLGYVTLMKGASGSGKSTILQAIAWCLYGNIRLVNPNTMEKAKTYVKINIGDTTVSGDDGNISADITVERFKNPNRLIVTYQGEMHEDKVAQSLIDDIFGSYDVWMASCYIGQGCRNNFLTSTNNGKMELLNSIAFHDDDPAAEIAKIDEKISTVDEDNKKLTVIFEEESKSLSKRMDLIDFNKTLSKKKRTAIQEQLANVQEERLRIEKKKKDYDIETGILNHLESTLKTILNSEKNIPQLKQLSTDMQAIGTSIEFMKESSMEMQDLILLLQTKEQFEKNLAVLPGTEGFKDQYKEEDLAQALDLEKQYAQNSNSAKELGIVYSRESIDFHINKITSTLNEQENIRKEHEIYNLARAEYQQRKEQYTKRIQERGTIQSKLTTLQKTRYNIPTKITVIVPTEAIVQIKKDIDAFDSSTSLLLTEKGSIENHIQHLVKNKDVLHLQCPQCKSTLRLQNNKILDGDAGNGGVVTTEAIKAKEQELAVINEKIKNVNSQIKKWQQDINSLQNKYEQDVKNAQEIHLEIQKNTMLEAQRLNDIKSLEEQLLQFPGESLLNDPLTAPVPPQSKILSQSEITKYNMILAKLNNLPLSKLPIVASVEISRVLNLQKSYEKYYAMKKEYAEFLNTTGKPLQRLFSNSGPEGSQGGPPITARLLKEYLVNKDKLEQENKRITEQINNLRYQKQDILTQIEQQKTKIANILSNLTPAGLTTLTSLTPTNLTPQGLKQALLDCDNKIKSLKEDLKMGDLIDSLNLEYSALEKKQKVIADNLDILTEYRTLRQYAVDTECKILQDVVDSINESISNVCLSMFDKDISITLNLFKTLKTTKDIKPGINFAISYQGGVFDNINQMSGGEGDRSSLALTLALNKLSGCPLLLLDESLGSLDLDLKEKAIKTIREHTNSTVLIIVHDGIEGIFDHVIDVENDFSTA